MAKIDWGQTVSDIGIGAAGKIVGGAIDSAFQEAAAKKAYERQIDFYKMQFKDNSPLTRVNQMKEAGLNVGLMYSGGASGIGGTVAAPHVPQASGNVNESLALGLQNRILQAQADNLAADAKLKNVQADKISGVDTEGTKIQNELNNIELKIKSESAETIVETIKQSLMNLEANADKTYAETENIQAQKANIILEGALIKSNTKLNDSKRDEIKSVIAKNYQEINNLINEIQAKNYANATERMKATNQIIEQGIQNTKIDMDKMLRREEMDNATFNAFIGVIGTLLGAAALGKFAGKPSTTIVDSKNETVKRVYDTKSGQVIETNRNTSTRY